MKYIIMALALALVGCAHNKNPKRSELICNELQHCAASLEQHPGQTDWYIQIWPHDCGIVQTMDGKEIPICGGERWVGKGDIEIKPGSCRVCTRQEPGEPTANRLVPRSLIP